MPGVRRLGGESFVAVRAGEMVERMRDELAKDRKLNIQALRKKIAQEVETEAGTDNVSITMGFVGQVAPNFGIDNMVLFMRGPDDGWLRVKLKEDSKIKLDEFREQLRKVLPERVIPWLAKRLETGGLPRDEAQQQADKCTFGFEPGEISELRANRIVN